MVFEMQLTEMEMKLERCVETLEFCNEGACLLSRVEGFDCYHLNKERILLVEGEKLVSYAVCRRGDRF